MISTQEMLDTIELPITHASEKHLAAFYKELVETGNLRLFTEVDDADFYAYLEKNDLLHNVGYDYGSRYVVFYLIP